MQIRHKHRDQDPYKNSPFQFPTYLCFKCRGPGWFGHSNTCNCRQSSKFSAKKIVCNGITFPSISEGARYSRLMFCQERLKLISALELQPEFKLMVNGQHVSTYTADFRFKDDSGEIVEEVKGRWTGESILRFKLFKAIYPDIRIRVIK